MGGVVAPIEEECESTQQNLAYESAVPSAQAWELFFFLLFYNCTAHVSIYGTFFNYFDRCSSSVTR